MALGAIAAIAAISAHASEAETRAAVVPFTDSTTPDEAARAVRDGVAGAFARAAAYGGVKVMDAAATSGTLSGAEARDRAAKLDAAAAQAKKGRALYAALDFEKAAHELEGARDALLPLVAWESDGALVDVLLDLGQADLDLHRADAARDAFRQARIDGAPAELPATYAPKTAAAYREAIAPLKARMPATLAIVSAPAGAKIAVDGRPVGVAPLMLTGLVDGPHVVRAEMNGRAPVSDSVTLTVGKTAHATLTLPAVIPEGADRGIGTGAPEQEFKDALALGDALHVDILLAAGIARDNGGPRVRTILVDVRRRVLIATAGVSGDPTEKATLDNAGTAAGLRARDWLKNAPPVPTPPPLQVR